jgi:hypothetical protein
MHKIELQWKEFNINLPALETQLRADYSASGYAGNQSTSSCLELWFEEEPEQTDKDAIEALWAAIDEEHELATSYKSADQLKAEAATLDAAILVLKQDAITKSWDQLSAVQRKILMGLPVTQAEIDA